MLSGEVTEPCVDSRYYRSLAIQGAVTRVLSSDLYDISTQVKFKWYPDRYPDFRFWGEPYYLQVLLNHIIDNLFFCLQQQKRQPIAIWTECGQNANYLMLQDQAPEPAMELGTILWQRYWESSDPSFEFCRQVMHTFGGDFLVDITKQQPFRCCFVFNKLA
jgi:hypothetical protein